MSKQNIKKFIKTSAQKYSIQILPTVEDTIYDNSHYRSSECLFQLQWVPHSSSNETKKNQQTPYEGRHRERCSKAKVKTRADRRLNARGLIVRRYETALHTVTLLPSVNPCSVWKWISQKAFTPLKSCLQCGAAGRTNRSTHRCHCCAVSQLFVLDYGFGGVSVQEPLGIQLCKKKNRIKKHESWRRSRGLKRDWHFFS